VVKEVLDCYILLVGRPAEPWCSEVILTCVLSSILLVYFVNSLQQQVSSNLSAYVVSDFASHELIASISIVSSLLSGILQIPTANILNIWGRAEGFAIMTAIATLGLLLMAACNNVETYAAAQVRHPSYESTGRRQANTYLGLL
jgi:MFS family permease